MSSASVSPSVEMTRSSDASNLISAASKNEIETVSKILRKGIDPSVTDYDKRSALHVSSSNGHSAVTELLISEGADVNCIDRNGSTPLDDAVSHHNEEIIRILRAHGGVNGKEGKLRLEDRLLKSSAAGDITAVKKLVAGGVSPNCCNYDLRTPLHLAVAEGHRDTIEFLIESGANIKAEDRFGFTPLKEAQRHIQRSGENPILELFDAMHIDVEHHSLVSHFAVLIVLMEVAIVIMYGCILSYGESLDGFWPVAVDPSFTSIYPLFQDVHVMIFIGFGFLMTFLRKHGYSSLGMTFLIGAIALQIYPLLSIWWDSVFRGDFNVAPIDISTFVRSDFSAGSVLITYGVVLGRVSPTQMVWVTIVEVCLYALNERIGEAFEITDLGGTMTIHMLGAFFGIGLSLAMKPSLSNASVENQVKRNEDNSAVYHSDIFAMVGTIFLWMFWPSFNGALAVGPQMHRATVNTILSLAASCTAAFVCSYVLRREGKFFPVDIQNATLAGGVAMGACADLFIQPGGAIAIGLLAGTLSTIGFVFVQPYLEEKIGLHDTCGVNNLHGMPSILGGIASVIAASQIDQSGIHQSAEQVLASFPSAFSRSNSGNAGMQLAYLGTSVGIGFVGGYVMGLILIRVTVGPKDHFSDAIYWDVPSMEIPFYFDTRGEIVRGKGNSAVRQKDGEGTLSVESKLSEMESKINALFKWKGRMSQIDSNGFDTESRPQLVKDPNENKSESKD